MRASYLDGTLLLVLDSVEAKVINNVLNWVCNGAHDVRGDEFVKALGVSEDEARWLLHRVNVIQREGRDGVAIALDVGDAVVMERAFAEALHGPLALPGVELGHPDWVLIGEPEEEFVRVRHDLTQIINQVGAPPKS